MTTIEKSNSNKILSGCAYITHQLNYLLNNNTITVQSYNKLRIVYRNMMDSPMRDKFKEKKEYILLVNIIYNLLKNK